ncbi:MAG: hypothetical protein ABIH92_05065 [Nanoarchaeota archaeon]
MLIELVVLILAIPVGFLIAYLANDELVAGRRWFVGIILLSVIVALWFVLTEGESAITWTCTFVIIVAAISLWKSFDKKWTKRRI